MRLVHPAERGFWLPIISTSLAGYVLLALLADGRFWVVLSFVLLGVFIATLTGYIVARVLLDHAMWHEFRDDDRFNAIRRRSGQAQPPTSEAA